MGTIPNAIIADIGSVPRCRTCQSERVVCHAYACWNPETGLWELEQTLAQAHCHRCDGPTNLDWVRPSVPQRGRVQELNDRFRREGLGRGSVMLTIGIQERGGAFAVAALKAVRAFDAFTPDNDPWGEHDFGALEVDGQKIFFKIDCYDNELKASSPNPANEAVTVRVLTLMLPEEY